MTNSLSPVSSLTEIAVAPLTPIPREWRMVVVGGRVVSSSINPRYVSSREGLHDDRLEGALEFANSMASIPKIPVYVMDVCTTPSLDYKIVELNLMNTSDLYSCDIEAIISSIDSLYGSR